ncbi:MAG: UDP-3-O-(3-hydroxymyristoyl)glucosamine N-acyltransferase, partial [Bacteroidales bacterium]|nr:UDP-3-O-(3-hydroxymyristoyl)glucosamine N-acyltransferase [Bacteroidales bacterium]
MELTAKFLAQLLKGSVDGDQNAKASKFAKIEHGKPGTLSFFANPKYEPYVYTSKASILIVDKTFQPKEAVTPTLIRVENAYTAIA